MRLKLRFSQIRDGVLLTAGLALLAHETVWTTEPRLALLTLAAGMIGLPATWAGDRKLISGSFRAAEKKPDEVEST